VRRGLTSEEEGLTERVSKGRGKTGEHGVVSEEVEGQKGIKLKPAW
jgi:hypothetical protein